MFSAGEPGPDTTRGTRPAPVAALDEYDGSARQLDVTAPVLSDPGIRIDGRLDDAAWDDAALLTGFTQYDPVEGAPASEHTEVRMLQTAEAFYFAIRADDGSGGVRATMTERDGFGRSDDYVRIILDTFDDQRRAYVFTVNPFGIQGDGLWSEGGGRGFGDPIDWSPDFLWQSNGQMDEAGYSVEVRIPIKSLRFPELESQDWGLQIQRSIRRTGYSQSWAPITGDQANRLAQSGKVRGLTNLDPGMFLEINPTVVGSVSGTFDPDRERLAYGSANSEMGLNVTYGLTSNLTLDGTVNPDFSQIEADAGQIAVNERFALFLREQRPFFLEGADVFNMPKRLVYTRSIVNPVGAAKISGKVGSFNVAYLGAVDDVSSTGENPIVNLLRVKRDVGASSSLGMVYTDRTQPGEGFNRVVGADARLVLGGRYTVEMLAAGSADGVNGIGTDYGSLLSASVRRSSRSLSMSASFEDVMDSFQAGSGFIRRTGVTQVEGRSSYTFRGKRGALVESWGPSIEAESFWQRSDFWAGNGPLETEVEVGMRAFFRGNIGAFLDYRRSSFNFGEDYYGDYFAGLDDASLAPLTVDPSLFGGLQQVSLRSWISTWERVRGSLGASWGETPIFAGGIPVDVGQSWGGDVGLTFVPTGAFQAEVGVRHSRIYRSRDGSEYSSATIPRIQGRYQISRSLFVRGIGEYSSQVRGDVLDPVTGEQVYTCGGDSCRARNGSDRHDFRLEGLLAYEPSPGTVVFFGYTREFEDTSGFGFRDVRPTADGLFLKLSYRFRM
ncbi:MAG: carbohydrate binding family 9 domain-containing protein [Gemmatimonadetes bacterium]|nr:carbohydrate binding family 9 domain-containing protein [Gemmatimonadota bacterium]